MCVCVWGGGGGGREEEEEELKLIEQEKTYTDKNYGLYCRHSKA